MFHHVQQGRYFFLTHTSLYLPLPQSRHPVHHPWDQGAAASPPVSCPTTPPKKILLRSPSGWKPRFACRHRTETRVADPPLRFLTRAGSTEVAPAWDPGGKNSRRRRRRRQRRKTLHERGETCRGYTGVLELLIAPSLHLLCRTLPLWPADPYVPLPFRSVDLCVPVYLKKKLDWFYFSVFLFNKRSPNRSFQWTRSLDWFC